MWGAWSNYGTCTKSCGGGTQQRRRSCDNPTPAHGGSACFGKASESRICKEQPCPGATPF